MRKSFENINPMSLCLAVLAAYAAFFLPVDALAQSVNVNLGGGSGGGSEPTALTEVLCNVVDWFSGPVGGGIATLAIIVVGIGALMGKVSWGMAIIVGIGVAIIFGAPTIVEALSSSAATC